VSRGSWIRLNGDGCIIALLCVLQIFDFIEPEKSDYVRQLGFVPINFYLWTGLYVLGGVVLIAGFVAPADKKIFVELAGRWIIGMAAGLQAWRTGEIFGYTTIEFYQTIIIFVGVCTFFFLRGSALMTKHGFTVVIGTLPPEDDSR
jgi:hypothetical protein